MKLRERHKAESSALGGRTYRFTEGGYCALFTEGMKRVGRDAFDDALAGICRQINEDEFNPMLLGIIGLDDAKMSPSDWDTLIRVHGRADENAYSHARRSIQSSSVKEPVG
ncbi:MAG: hypothetical protein O7C67_02390 [Gammaproteobacteria bacterium]|nr:hypothetical protein [Gammaproteobacteria bacterium]MCZ6852396.1 hypothetical protein [Gammaproteobacteria bacterium]